jgi:glycosyltransferase involved in cell wall biosynthesis
LGLSLDKPTNPNYRWSLPNKLFDAFQAGLPQVVSPVEEVARLVQTFEAGWVVPEVEPLSLAHVFRHALSHPDERQRAREGALRAAQRYQWDVESQGWHRIIDRLEGKAPHVHIVSMDLPIPPLYGGMAEVKSQIDALLASGHSVELHAFLPASNSQEALESWMERHPVSDSSTGPLLRLWTYRRGGASTALWSRLPYLLASRASVPLVRRLTSSPLPIVAHGYHSLWPALVSRVLAQRTFLRLHNPERIYYRGLAEAEIGSTFRSFLKRTYYRLEARRLARLEQKILPKLPLASVWALTPGDAEATAPFFRTPVAVLPPAVPALLSCPSDQSATYLHALGIDRPFLLVHGKLSVAENDWAAHQFLDLWLAPSPEPMFRDYRLVIAGQGASGALRRRAADAASSGVVFVDTPEDLEMAVLLRAAAGVEAREAHTQKQSFVLIFY